MNDGPGRKNLALGLISTGRDRPSVRRKSVSSPPLANTGDDDTAPSKPTAGRTRFQDLVAKGTNSPSRASRGARLKPNATSISPPLPRCT
jgi:hypothetical protein